MRSRGDGLSKREREVLTCLLDGMSTKEIGDTLAISPRTVQKHLTRIYAHLDVSSRAEAIVQAHRQGK